MGRAPKTSLPLIPLARDAILLPGLVQRITVTSSRPDVAALLAHVYERAASKGSDGRIDSVPIACVPVGSPLVGPNGQLLISSGEEVDTSQIEEVNPGAAKRNDLFHFGVAAKIVGIDGRGSGEFALRVEGTARVRIDNIIRERPFFEGQVTYFNDECMFTQPVNFHVDAIHTNISSFSSGHCRQAITRPLCDAQNPIPRTNNYPSNLVTAPSNKDWPGTVTNRHQETRTSHNAT